MIKIKFVGPKKQFEMLELVEVLLTNYTFIVRLDPRSSKVQLPSD